MDKTHFIFPFINWWTFGLLPFFFSAIMNISAVNIYVQVFVWTYIFNSLGWYIYLGVEFVGSYDNLTFWGAAYIPKQLYCLTFPLEMYKRVPVSPYPCLHIVVYLLGCSNPSECEVAPHCRFAFPWWLMILISFHVLISYVYILWRNIYLDPLPI